MSPVARLAAGHLKKRSASRSPEEKASLGKRSKDIVFHNNLILQKALVDIQLRERIQEALPQRKVVFEENAFKLEAKRDKVETAYEQLAYARREEDEIIVRRCQLEDVHEQAVRDLNTSMTEHEILRALFVEEKFPYSSSSLTTDTIIRRVTTASNTPGRLLGYEHVKSLSSSMLGTLLFNLLQGGIVLHPRVYGRFNDLVEEFGHSKDAIDYLIKIGIFIKDESGELQIKFDLGGGFFRKTAAMAPRVAWYLEMKVPFRDLMENNPKPPSPIKVPQPKDGKRKVHDREAKVLFPSQGTTGTAEARFPSPGATEATTDGLFVDGILCIDRPSHNGMIGKDDINQQFGNEVVSQEVASAVKCVKVDVPTGISAVAWDELSKIFERLPNCECVVISGMITGANKDCASDVIDAAIHFLVGACHNVKILVFRGNDLGDSGLQQFHATRLFERLPFLRAVDLSDCGIFDCGLLASALENIAKLESLCVSENNFKSNEGIKQLASILERHGKNLKLIEMNDLKSVGVEDNEVEYDALAAAITDSLDPTQIEHMSFIRCKVAGFRSVHDFIQHCTNLEVLNVEDNGIRDDETMSSFLTALSWHPVSLKVLDLSYCREQPTEPVSLEANADLKQEEDSEVCAPNYQAEPLLTGLRAFASGKPVSIVKLILEGLHLTTAAGIVLFGNRPRRLAHLEELNLSENPDLGPDFLKTLESCDFPKLLRVDLRGTGIERVHLEGLPEFNGVRFEFDDDDEEGSP